MSSNSLNDLSKVYLDQVAKIHNQNTVNDKKRWEELGGPTPQDYKPTDDSAKLGESKVESNVPSKDRKKINDRYKGLFKKDLKGNIPEGYSAWRNELFEGPGFKGGEKEAGKKVDEKKGINNKIIINPKLNEAVKRMGGELIEATELSEDKEEREKTLDKISKDAKDILKQEKLHRKAANLDEDDQGREQQIQRKQLMLDRQKLKLRMRAQQTKKKDAAGGGTNSEAQANVIANEGYKPIDRKKEVAMYRRAGNLARQSFEIGDTQSGSRSADIVRAIGRNRKKVAQDNAAEKIKQQEKLKKEEFEAAVEYFYAEGINEEGLDLIIEEVGLDDFVDFISDDDLQFLNEERAARKMNVRTLKTLKTKTIPADAEKEAKRREQKKGEYKETPKKKTKVGLSYATKVKPEAKKPVPKPAPKPVAKKPAPKPAPKEGAMKKDKASHDTGGFRISDKEASAARERLKKKVAAKKVEKAVAKAKPAQPKKEVSKGGLRDKLKSAYKAGVKRHRKATQPARIFHKGLKSGARTAVKAAKDVKKAVVGEERKEVKASIQEPKEKLKKPSRSERVAYHPPGPNSARRSYKLEQVEVSAEGWKPDPVEKRKKKAADLHRRETIASATPAKYKTDKTEDPDKLYRRRMAVDSKTKIRKEEIVLEKVKGEDTEKRKEMARERGTKGDPHKKQGDPSKRLSPGVGKAHADKMTRDIRFYDKITKRTKPAVVGMTEGDFWHPDPEKDRRISGQGNKQRAREDRKRTDPVKAMKNYAKTQREDKAFDNVVAALRKKHGESGVLTKDSPKPKAQPQSKKKPEKDTRSSAQREVDARYGRTPWNKKGSLGT